jgi:predicted TIM-barrel fold metal-dependent hydrolase
MAVFREAVDKYGVQVCGEVKYRMMYDNPDALEMFRFCGDAGLPVVLHFDYPDATECGDKYVRHNWWCGGGIDVLERLLNLCPKTNFLGHAPGFWGHISNDDLAWTKGYSDEPVIPGGRVEYLLEHYSNLYCDMSAGSGAIALSRDIDYSRRLIERFPDRFLYGRDGFHDKHDKLLEALNLQGEIAELVFHGNALRLARKL